MTSATVVETEPLSKGERTQARIIEAAVDRFGTNGFRATSVAAIARDAGVSAAAPFAYWPSKEALFDAAVDADARSVIKTLLERLAEFDDDPSIWLDLVSILLSVLGTHPLARRVLAGQEPDSIDRLLRLPAFDELREVLTLFIAEGQASGEINPAMDPARAAIGVESVTLAMTMAVLQLSEPLDPARTAGVAELLLAAFRV
ncbi:MAG TPA: helix-turn-helix domain-containing protein [Acidimicrobiales bacterium]|nr:helix-turn-helix domain-containing protein [Acidimicrobiales bacterium]